MPGIVGIIGKGPRAKHEGDLKLMLDCMMHEPFYGSGTYVNESLGVYVGWTCHHDSFADCLPAMNGSKDVILVFAGEDFSEASEPRRKASALVALGPSKAIGRMRGKCKRAVFFMTKWSVGVGEKAKQLKVQS